ncbi:MAG: transglycosylase SLT domain-containing protein [Methylophilus sp.]|nr:transglycosylase SLT domain-containing protein [Methylophilus sp.]
MSISSFHFKKMTRTLCVLVLLFQAMYVMADAGDDEFLNAKAAYEKRNAFALAESVSRLKNQNYLLAPYADYWLMLLNLDAVSNDEMNAFLARYSALPFADRLRGEWLKQLGKKQDWPTFLSVYTQYQSSDAGVTCYAAEASAAVYGAQTLESAKSLWFKSREQPTNCNDLFDQLQAAKVLSEDDIFERFNMALSDNRIALAKGIAKRSRLVDEKLDKQIDLAFTKPQLVLSKKSVSTSNRYGRALYLLALTQLAKTDSIQALAMFKKLEQYFNAQEKSDFYGKLALNAAKRHEPQAYDWFQLAENSTLSKEEFEWYARSALRRTDWNALSEVIALMPPDQADEPVWRYWKARAYKAQNKMLEANSIFAPLSTERHYYGWLAQEELESSMSASPDFYVPTHAEVDAFAKLDQVKRADALQRLDLVWESKMEWASAIDGFDDRQLLAAAAYASRKKWFDISVMTADKTKELHNYDLRYPTPYRDLINTATKDKNIDEAWVYGIVRQESRFMHYAKSHVGASGLMQLMPATAKWIAKKVGFQAYNNGMIHELDTNITLGTAYMKSMLDQFNGQETMTTAGYNAGPSRAKKWMGEVPLEGAIYAETIPFDETRDYVKKVMSNAHLYSQRLGLKSMPLKTRLGTVPARNPAVEIIQSSVE